MPQISKKIVISQIVLIFILPVALLYFNVVSSDWRVFLLALCSLFIYGIIRHEKWTHEDMGLNNNFKEYLIPYVVFTIVSVALIFLIDSKIGFESIRHKPVLIEKLLFFLPISFFQEFAFRAFLIHRLRLISKSNFVIISVNVVLFTLIHVIYPSLNVILPVTFIGGILFAWLYIKYPNFLLISLAHSVVNVTAVLLGFFGTN
ncbi:MAG: CPBP family intramembrane metalloprotease [Candidatus Pacebacteria bacterium]|nr:CPBP family intramembrane metalloprotease [Candidatus Paceibacterota bacterium]MBP9839667.1 CPBP family intramembrane metalloprotease [Candidatus Paceibacterota bacterium]MDQ5922713.1 protease family protein [Patescibacteria group bacterium]